MKQKPNLEPCPFCGGQASYDEVECDHGVRSWVMCCGCGVCIDSADSLPDKTPVEAWNTRVKSPK